MPRPQWMSRPMADGWQTLMDRIKYNPVGTETLAPTFMQNQGDASSFDPVIGQWPTGAPMTQSQYDNTKTTSLNLFSQLANIAAVPDRAPTQLFPKSVYKSMKVGENTPTVEPRSINADYPNGVPRDATGRITHDIDGNLLNPGAMVAGRSQMGSPGVYPDVGLLPSGIERVGTQAGGAQILEASQRSLGKDTVGTFTKGYDPQTDAPKSTIEVLNSLSEPKKDIVLAHEVGHAVDWLAKDMPVNRLTKELKTVYEDLNTPTFFKPGKGARPQDFGYKGDDVDREYMAEAVRAYMQNPNYLKSVAPKTAELIRSKVNGNPLLKNVIQFNGMGGLMVGANQLIPQQQVSAQ